MNGLTRRQRDGEPMGYETLVIIPARGGSKGIAGKNTVDLGGRPLLAYTIEAARKSRHVSRVVVTTDSPHIAAVAREYGADVPFLRPARLAGDSSPLQDVTSHCIASLEAVGYRADIHCILLPTHPFRQPRLLDEAIGYVFQGYHNVHAVRPVDLDATCYCACPGEGVVRPLRPLPGPWPGPRRTYRRYGNLAVFAPGIPTVGSKPIVIDNPIELIDIDTPDDLALAREVVSHNLYDFDLA